MQALGHSTSNMHGPNTPPGIRNEFKRNKEPHIGNSVSNSVVGLLSLLLILFLPAIFSIWWIALELYDCSILKALGGISSEPAILFRCYQPPRLHIAAVFLAWISFQAVLYTALPGLIYVGQPTPAGETLSYKLNGFKCWFTTILVILILWATGMIEIHFVALHWAEFLSASAYYAWVMAILAFIKAHVAPSSAADRKFSGAFEQR
jgi:7-dehydrocholesterol reductase